MDEKHYNLIKEKAYTNCEKDMGSVQNKHLT